MPFEGVDEMDERILSYVLFISKVESNKIRQGEEVHKKRLEKRLELFGLKQEGIVLCWVVSALPASLSPLYFLFSLFHSSFVYCSL